MSEWISVNDRLPKYGYWYLAFSNDQIEILFLDSGNPVLWLQAGDWIDEVTHWMPLPKAP